jgi:hypothetical protein
MLNVVMLSVIMLSVIMLMCHNTESSSFAQCLYYRCLNADCRGAEATRQATVADFFIAPTADFVGTILRRTVFTVFGEKGFFDEIREQWNRLNALNVKLIL